MSKEESDIYCGGAKDSCLFHSKEHPVPKCKKPKLTVDVDTIMSQVVPLFTSKKDCTEALEYAIALAKAEGVPKGVMAVAIMCYHNTLLYSLVDDAIEKARNMQGVVVKNDNSEEHF